MKIIFFQKFRFLKNRNFSMQKSHFLQKWRFLRNLEDTHRIFRVSIFRNKLDACLSKEFWIEKFEIEFSVTNRIDNSVAKFKNSMRVYQKPDHFSRPPTYFTLWIPCSKSKCPQPEVTKPPPRHILPTPPLTWGNFPVKNDRVANLWLLSLTTTARFWPAKIGQIWPKFGSIFRQKSAALVNLGHFWLILAAKNLDKLDNLGKKWAILGRHFWPNCRACRDFGGQNGSFWAKMAKIPLLWPHFWWS